MVFSFFPFHFWFWFLVLALLSRYSRGAWCFFWGGIGLGWVGVHYTTQGKFALDWTYRYMLPFLIDEMGGVMEGRKGGGGVRTLFAENREPTEICHCWPRGGFFCFYEVGWLVVLPYLALPLS